MTLASGRWIAPKADPLGRCNLRHFRSICCGTP